jgi:hypothetical protein
MLTQTQPPVPKPISLTIGQGIIQIEKGDITKQTVSFHLYSFKVLSFFL